MLRPRTPGGILTLAVFALLPGFAGAQGISSQPQATPRFPIETRDRGANFEELHRDRVPNAGIQDILRLEKTSTSVPDAIEWKTKGLKLVKNLADFHELTQFVVENPSKAYKEAVADFLVRYVGNYLDSDSNLGLIRDLEERCVDIYRAKELKQKAMVAVHGLPDFLELIRFAAANPSHAYRDMVGEFISDFVGTAVQSTDSIHDLVTLEGRVRDIYQAEKVKQAGLALVHSTSDFRQLLEFAVESPSTAYKKMVAEFMVEHISQAVFPDTQIFEIHQLERLSQDIHQAIRVKEAGLPLVKSLAELEELARPVVETPSQAYKEAVAKFLRDYAGTFLP